MNLYDDNIHVNTCIFSAYNCKYNALRKFLIWAMPVSYFSWTMTYIFLRAFKFKIAIGNLEYHLLWHLWKAFFNNFSNSWWSVWFLFLKRRKKWRGCLVENALFYNVKEPCSCTSIRWSYITPISSHHWCRSLLLIVLYQSLGK